MKKYLFSALALPLLFACSSDELTEKEFAGNDKFAGIEKVDATFFMNEGPVTRMATDWALEEGDMYGFAWMGGGAGANALTINGNAYQNHPLTQKDGIFKPATSIYVGNYYLYRPYDETVVDIEKINFKSLEEQTLKDGMGGDAWKALANGTIIIGDKWTNVTKTGWTDAAGTTWDKAGINQHYDIYAAVFSNQTGLDLTYQKNNVDFGGKSISGATDISYTYPAGSTIGAADIYKIEATLTGATQSFQYAPTTEPNAGAHNGNFWETQKGLGTAFDFTTGAAFVTLEAPDENGISTDKADNKGWFWFNSLPVDLGNATSATTVNLDLETSYGIVNVNQPLSNCAYAYEDPAGTSMGAATYNPEWLKLAAADNLSADPKEIDPTTHNTFVNQYGNHKGKYALTVDFSTGKMNGMHIKNDTHLQKALKYYIAAGKTESPVVLELDKDADNEFKISKISIALLQSIAGNPVKVRACGTDATHTPAKIVVTQDGQDAIGLADKKEVPALNNVFATATDVYLSKNCDWTWTGGTTGATPYKTPLAIDANVNSITNEGTLTVNAENVQLSLATTTTVPAQYTLANAAGATMNITKVTTVKNALTNLGTINVGAADNTTAELRAYDIEIKNDATSLTAQGLINNYGVVGVTYATSGTFNNYGKIDMKTDDAITLLTSNQTTTANFNNAFAATNKLGTVLLPENNPTALVSVSNAAENGFIKYTWTGGTRYSTPTGNVKYNTIVVSSDIEFRSGESEIQYIEFNGTRTQVINPSSSSTDKGNLYNLKGIIVNDGKSIIIEKTNGIVCSNGAYLGNGAAIYQGGYFTPNNANVSGKTVTDYLGTWNTDQVVKF